MKYRTVFLILLLIVSSHYSLAIAAEENNAGEKQCVLCGKWAIPGQHDDCPKLVEKDKKIEELEKELDEMKKQKEQEGKQQDALGVLDLVKVPVKGLYGMGKTIYNGIKDATGYMCDKCNTYQYGSHICTPTSCSVCGAIGSHQCPGPTIEVDESEPPIAYDFSCDKCGVSMKGIDYDTYMKVSGSHGCPGSQ